MDAQLEFSNTYQDVIDAHEAQRLVDGGLRPWARGLMVMLGILWVMGFFVLVGDAESTWQPFASLGAGVFVLWNSALQPLLERRRIKMENPQSQRVSLTFSDRGIHVCAQGQDEFTRPWEDLIDLLPAKKGLLMRFSGGITHWVPARAFKERQALERFIGAVQQELANRGLPIPG